MIDLTTAGYVISIVSAWIVIDPPSLFKRLRKRPRQQEPEPTLELTLPEEFELGYAS